MSKKKLQDFLTKIDKELSKSDGSKDFRSQKANKRLHLFRYKKSKIEDTLLLLLKRSNNIKAKGSTLEEVLTNLGGVDLAKEFNLELNKLGREMLKSFRRITHKEVEISPSSVPRDFKVTVLVIEGDNTTRDNFNLIKRTYKVSLNRFYRKTLVLLNRTSLDRKTAKSEKNPDGVYKAEESGDVFHLEHAKNSSNIQHFINNSIHESISSIYGDIDDAELTKLVADLRTLQLFKTLNVEKNLKTGTIDVFLGSQIINSKQSAQEKKIRKDVQDKLKKALNKLDTLEGLKRLKGSDSLEDSVRKKAVKASTDPFKKLKNVKVITEDTKIDGLISSASINIKQGKITRGRNGAIKTPKKRVRNSSGNNKSLGSSPLAYIQLLNSRLPAQIAKNMRSPRLNYRTGRFASSVRVVNAATTAQGYLSFGYTYMKGPYQTFEPGYAQGSVDRDPRKLIDRSMREIAVEFAIGRFYTRRE